MRTDVCILASVCFFCADKTKRSSKRNPSLRRVFPLNNPRRLSLAVCAYVDTSRAFFFLPHLWGFPPLLSPFCLRWLCSSEAFEARQKQPSHRQDKLRAVCVTRFDPSALSEMLYFTPRPERCCCSHLCLLWYCLITLSEHFDVHGNKGSFWILNQAFHRFIFWIFFSRPGRCSGPSRCSHLSSIINHSDSCRRR